MSIWDSLKKGKHLDSDRTKVIIETELELSEEKLIAIKNIVKQGLRQGREGTDLEIDVMIVLNERREIKVQREGLRLVKVTIK